MGAVTLPIGVVLIAISEIFHPAREDPMDFPAVFEEYAQSNVWTTVHLGEYCGFLLLLGGLVALYYSVSARPGVGAGLAPFGFAAAVTTAASFTVLQAVDGITLRYAVDAWASAPAPQKAAAFAAAEVARWTEIGMNSLSYFLAGLTLFLFGLAIALGRVYPRWVGLMAAVSGAAFMYNGAVVVAYEGFVPSIVKDGGPSSVGGVGVRHGSVHVAQRWSPAHRPSWIDSHRIGAAPGRHPLTVRTNPGFATGILKIALQPAPSSECSASNDSTQPPGWNGP